MMRYLYALTAAVGTLPTLAFGTGRTEVSSITPLVVGIYFLLFALAASRVLDRSLSLMKRSRRIGWCSTILVLALLTSCAELHKKPKTASGKDGNQAKPFIPSLSDPEIHRIEIPERIEGNKFIERHFEWVIEKPSGWTR